MVFGMKKMTQRTRGRTPLTNPLCLKLHRFSVESPLILRRFSINSPPILRCNPKTRLGPPKLQGRHCEHYVNKMKGFKSLWSRYEEMLKNTSGFGYDSETKMFTADPEVWDTYLQSHPNDAIFRREPVEDYELLRAVLGGVVSTGDDAVIIYSTTSEYNPPSTMRRMRRESSPSHEIVEDEFIDESIHLGANDGGATEDTLLDDTATPCDSHEVPPQTSDVRTSQTTSVSHKKRRGSSSATSMAPGEDEMAFIQDFIYN